MCTGGNFYDNSSYRNNPVARAYNDIMNQLRREPEEACYQKDKSYPSWDLLTVYSAIVGPDAAEMQQESGTDVVDMQG